jgi:NAD(P)H-hydrate epimerase
MLADKGMQVRIFILKITDQFSADFLTNYQRLIEQEKAEIYEIQKKKDFPACNSNDVVIDALFGSGLTRPLEGIAAELVVHINKCRNTCIAIDIPSGLFVEDNTGNTLNHIIKADYTLSFQFPKISFLLADVGNYAGKWAVLPIGLHPEAIEKTKTCYHYTTAQPVKAMIKPRERFSHKGTFGHALLISGSYGKMGACVLASRACLHTGAGLLTTHIPKSGYNIIQTAVPEAMASIDESTDSFSTLPELETFNCMGIGPGIGTAAITQKAMQKTLTSFKGTIVLDADALNILAGKKDWMKQLAGRAILTPHPGEFDRLAGKSGNAWERLQKLLVFVKKHQTIVVLKGAYTSIALPDGNCYFNSTGNAGMATAGSGDALTGVILSLLSQGYALHEAAILGVYLHGLAGDIARSEKGEEALIASDIIDNIGKAFFHIKNS